jgi:hypothetical protein
MLENLVILERENGQDSFRKGKRRARVTVRRGKMEM